MIQYNNLIISGTLEVKDGISGSLFGTASYVETASFALTALTASYLSGSVTVNTASLLTTASFNQYTSSVATTGSNQFKSDQIITGSLVIGAWRMRESGSNLAVEKWNGAAWVQSGYFEI